jgi:class 3 adenylate cyclase
MVETKSIMAFDLTQREFTNIDEYRKKKNTAVLTIMFTDIQGFTALTENNGEAYVHAIHEAHDKILVDTVEDNGAGVVIKFIGDSIMAVFAEPTAAAEKALLIQKRLAEFNAAHPELDDIKVRIGLHMGQTVIENKIQTDLFGRHVNKASRVESLASGGHVYCSYPVFDSAKSWLLDSPGARSTCHGSYYLKGIDRPEEIYEIWNDGITTPEAPKGARKAGAIPKQLVAGIAACAILAAVAVGLFATRGLWSGARANTGTPQETTASANTTVTSTDGFADEIADGSAAETATQKDEPKPIAKADSAKAPTVTKTAEPAEVHFLGMIAREPILDFDTPLAVILEDESTGLKKSITDIASGNHVVHFVVSYMVRYFAEFTVKPGKNVIPIKFKESYLPSVDINYNVSSGGATPDSITAEGAYFLYDRKTLSRVDYKGKVSAHVKGKKTESGMVEFTVNYAVAVNGKEVAAKTLTVTSDPKATDWTHIPEEAVYTEGEHYYFMRYEYISETIQVSVGAAFKN